MPDDGDNRPKSLAERVATVETDMVWVKAKLETIDNRTWYTLAAVVVFGIISIIIALIGFMPKGHAILASLTLIGLTVRSKSKAFETALSIIQADLMAEKLGEKIQPIIEKPKLSTRIIDLANVPVQGEEVLLDLDGEGVLEKLLLRSPNANFRISLTTEKVELEGDYTHFQDVCAYQEDDTYVLEITNIEFAEKVRLVVKAEAITFSKIFIKYCLSS